MKRKMSFFKPLLIVITIALQLPVFTALAGISASDSGPGKNSYSKKIDAITVNVDAGTIVCFGGTTTLTATATGGTGTITYRLNNGSYQSSNTFTVPAGTYTITAKDANDITGESDEVVVTQPSAITSSFNTTQCDSFILPWGGTVTTSGSYMHTYTAVNGCDSVVTANVQIDTIVANITGPTNSCRYTLPEGDTATYVMGVSNATSITWTVPTSAILISGQGTNTIKVQFDPAYGGGTLSVAVVRACSGDTIVKNINVTPSIPSVNGITGPTNACPFLQNSSSATYTVPSNSNTLYFNWTLPPGMSFANNDTLGTSVTVNFQQGYPNFTLKVQSVSGCGYSDTLRYTITVARPIAPTLITGETNSCPYINVDTVIYYTIRKVASAATYIWTVPAGITIFSHPGGEGTANDTIIGVKFTNAFVNGTFIAVQTSSPCGLSLAKNLTITRSQAPLPGVITGISNSCVVKVGSDNPTGTPTTYKINKVRFANGYVWTVPNHVTILSHSGTGINDTAITVRFESAYAGGSISVQSITGCGTSVMRSIVVKDAVMGSVGVIKGATNPCPLIGGPDTTTYRIPKVTGATSYNWSVPSGADIVNHPGGTGVNDTIIVVTWTASFTTGSITVTPQNNCSIGRTTRSLAIVRKLPAIPAAISGLLNPCQVSGATTTYSIAALPANANAVQWSVPAGATIIGANNGLSIEVAFADTFVSGTIAVTSYNNCATGPTRSLNVSRKLPSVPTVITVSTVATCPSRVFQYSIASLPANSISVYWTIPSGATIVSGQGTEILTVSYPSLAVSGQITCSGINGCNQAGTARSLAVTMPACPPPARQGSISASSLLTGLEMEVSPIAAKIYPNPSVTGFTLQVKTNSNERMWVRVLDMMGNIQKQMWIMPGDTQIFGAELKSGAYVVEVTQGRFKTTQRIIKL